MKWFTATKDHYADALHRASPPGRLFATLSAGMQALYNAIGNAIADAHNNAIRIIDESHPATATELLDQWLAAYGLPEPGTVLPPTDDERRALLIAKIKTKRGQSPARMIAIAAALGVVATVTEWFDVGRPLTWRMTLPGEVTKFRAGISKAGDKLTDFTTTGAAIKQQVERAKPAHTIVEWMDV